MIRTFALVVVVGTSLVSTNVLAQTTPENQPPICGAKTLTIQPLPEGVEMTSLHLDPVSAAPACTDADGDSLVMTEVSGDAVLDENNLAFIQNAPAAGQTANFSFTVTDGKGGEAHSTFTLVRQ